MNQTGKLYIVSSPIGNRDDITTRAIDALRTCDAVLCEEHRVGSSLLKQYGIEKPLIELNEHNENEMIQQVLFRLSQGQNLALISDCGTPVFFDPGRQLIRLLYESEIPIVAVPGVSSLMTALSLCPFNMNQFLFLGFLPAKTELRAHVLQQHSRAENALVLMDTPYRMAKLLSEVAVAFGKNQPVFLACDLTMTSETIYQGTIQNVIAKVQNRKAEFILVIEKPQRRPL